MTVKDLLPTYYMATIYTMIIFFMIRLKSLFKLTYNFHLNQVFQSVWLELHPL